MTKGYITSLRSAELSPALVQRMVSLIDLTRLDLTDTPSSMARFFTKAHMPLGQVAAVCVYPQFVLQAHAEFANTSIHVATVVNFPGGQASLESVLSDITRVLQEGAQEIDVVFPYSHYLMGEYHYVEQFIASCKAACGEQALLKIILETGVLKDPTIIAAASLIALNSGADFLKTSTGKIASGASLEAAAIILLVLKNVLLTSGRRIGIKISGGITHLQQAAQYIQLACDIMGPDWVTARTFRIGSSKLIDEIRSQYT